ncbi:hypothetical protein ACRRTK_024972 [Alexandromys fortis]
MFRVRKQREKSMLSAGFLLFTQSGTPDHGMVSLTFKTVLIGVAEDGLRVLPRPPKCTDYRHTLPLWVYVVRRIELGALCQQALYQLHYLPSLGPTWLSSRSSFLSLKNFFD